VRKVAINMASIMQRPEWLTDKEIEKMKKWIENCPNPYTKEEVDSFEYDISVDATRLQAYEARRILTEYGII